MDVNIYFGFLATTELLIKTTYAMIYLGISEYPDFDVPLGNDKE